MFDTRMWKLFARLLDTIFGQPTAGPKIGTVGSMSIGQVGFVRPEDLIIENDSDLWLEAKCGIYGGPSTDARVRVESKSDGYHISMSSGSQHNTTRRVRDVLGTTYLPVVKVNLDQGYGLA